ncbi:mitosis initiation protein fs(1)Ya [Culex pipiens pallens]|uniref:mitosis initiation protein fs(1)Ya n=1 Tax=Culex pipiens pallens TaxID=42434 RepID=UPI0022AB1ABE|nr:mitosis initiation protein fs(1)Ya [Culex pipiens pallens]
MKIPKEVQCRTCAQVFCCGKCRQKHEDVQHQDVKAIRQICYICNNRPFPLRVDTKISGSNVLVEHILREHLPLRCNRCAKVFHTAADFKSIARCLTAHGPASDQACHLEHSQHIPTILENVAAEGENKENIDENNSATSSERSTHNSAPQTAIKVKLTAANTPQISKELRAITDPPEDIEPVNEAMLTPLSMINLRWKRKSRQSFDSMLSTTNNISAVNASEGAMLVPPSSPAKKLVRTTSTPMMHGCLPHHHHHHKMTSYNESYSSAMGQMSSIHANSTSEQQQQQQLAARVRAIIRSRSKAVAATPLRQVMSKSIQRAIAQHGYSKLVAPGTQRKMSFNSTGGSSISGSPARSALDLRTTPVLKRCSSASSGHHRTAKMVRLGVKSRSEDSSNASTLEDRSVEAGSEYYETHQNVDSLNSTADQENLEKVEEVEPVVIQFLKPMASSYQETPRVAGGMLKKVIAFTSPDVTRLGVVPRPESEDEGDDDVWSTPCGAIPPPRSFSCSALKDLGRSEETDDDVFLPPANPLSPTKSKSCKQLNLDSPGAPSTGKLWTIVSSVIRLASRQDIQDDLTTNDSTKLTSTLAQKAASFAGFLKNKFPGASRPNLRSSSGSDEFSAISPSGGIKRRRSMARPYESRGNNPTVAPVYRTSSSPLPKRKRIQGRKPIERMRNESRSESGSDF